MPGAPIGAAWNGSPCGWRPSGQRGTAHRAGGAHRGSVERRVDPMVGTVSGDKGLKRLRSPGGLEIWCSQNSTLSCWTARSGVAARRSNLAQSALMLDVTWFDRPAFRASANGKTTPSRDCCTAGQGSLRAWLARPCTARTLAGGPWTERWTERWILLWITLWISGRL